MFKKLFMLFKIGRKLSTSGAISSFYEIYNPPVTIKILFSIIGLNLGSKKNNSHLVLQNNIVFFCCTQPHPPISYHNLMGDIYQVPGTHKHRILFILIITW